MSETTTAVRSALTWFEIPVADFDRARKFYETIFETPLNEMLFEGSRIAVFAYEEPGVGGCLQEGSSSKPGDRGVLVYLPAHGRIDRALELVASAGGRISDPKMEIPNVGFVAHVIDSEGNQVGLHSKS